MQELTREQYRDRYRNIRAEFANGDTSDTALQEFRDEFNGAWTPGGIWAFCMGWAAATRRRVHESSSSQKHWHSHALGEAALARLDDGI